MAHAGPPSPYRSYDRFIPNRSSSHIHSSLGFAEPSQDLEGAAGKLTGAQLQILQQELVGDENSGSHPSSLAEPAAGNVPGSPIQTPATSLGPAPRLLQFSTPPRRTSRAGDVAARDSLATLSPASKAVLSAPRTRTRRIPTAPVKVLDAPGLADDFYLNLVDWSAANCVAVGLGSIVYIWDADSATVAKLTDTGQDGTVTSVSWSRSGRLLHVGTSSGTVGLWDVEAETEVRRYTDHRGRVASGAWSATTLATGSKDGRIRLRDVRSPSPAFQTLTSHRQEVCGLAWSPDSRLLASGGNDNRLLVWDSCSLRRPGQSPAKATVRSTPLFDLSAHKAAVKALAWSPHKQGLLASGGGTADKTIRLWNTLTGSELATVPTSSQVCALGWSANVDELVSSHGYSANEIVVWKADTMTQVASLTGHTYRVLYLSLSPDGQTVVTGAGDETLRFWHVFPPAQGETARATAGLEPAGAAGGSQSMGGPRSTASVLSGTITSMSAPGTPQRSLAAMR